MNKFKKNICIIAGHYAYSNDGIGRYTLNLKNNLKILNSHWNVKVIGYKTSLKNQPINATNRKINIPSVIINPFKIIRTEIEFYNRFVKNNTLLLDNLRNVKADIYHAMSPSESYAALKLNKRPLITTIHDVIPLISKNRYLMEKYYFNYYCKFAVKSDYIIVDSQSTKRDLLKYFSLNDTKVKVVYPSYDQKLFYPKKFKKNNSKKIIVYMGGLERRKGIYETLFAFIQLLSIRKDLILIIGGQGNEKNKIINIINKFNLKNSVKLLGFVEDEKLLNLYNCADLFVYPSKYEGFGLTPLEAMACGLPVITSLSSSLPEVVGNAALKINPNSTEEIFNCMKLVLENKEIEKNLRYASLNQAKKFNWEKTIKEITNIYQTLD